MKILVGLSGGVDSAIAAYLLKEQGHEVTCCFMRNWDSMANNDFLGNPTINDDVCPQEQDYMDALSVAKSLGLELLRVDYVKEYWDNVFDTFLKAIASSSFFSSSSLFVSLFIISIKVSIISFASFIVFPFKVSIIIDVDA